MDIAAAFSNLNQTGISMTVHCEAGPTHAGSAWTVTLRKGTRPTAESDMPKVSRADAPDFETALNLALMRMVGKL